MHEKIMRKVAAIAATIALSLSITFGTATPASAALSDCWNGTVCLFAHGSYGNPIWRQVVDEIPGCRSLVGTGWNDVMSSAANQYTYGVVLIMWEHSNCTGSYYSLAGDMTVNMVGYWWDNKVSAVSLVLT